MTLTTTRRPLVRRHRDFGLSEEQQGLEAAVRAFLTRHCPTTRVRDAELGSPPGYDIYLWDDLRAMGLVSMVVPEARGGDGAGLLEAVLVSELLGRSLAPVPYVDAVVAARLLSEIDTPPAEGLLDTMLAGRAHVCVALQPWETHPRQLIGSGALGGAVIAPYKEGLFAVLGQPRQAPPNLASAPVAWWDSRGTSQSRITSGSDGARAYERALLDWRLLTAAALIGVADAAVSLGVDYAKTRVAFDVPIGSFQAISHPLVDSAVAVAGGRRLVRRAAWTADHEESAAPRLAHIAFLHACETAGRATALAMHVLGGLGMTNESDLQLYFRRAKGWPLLAGDPQRSLDAIGADIATPALSPWRDRGRA